MMRGCKLSGRVLALALLAAAVCPPVAGQQPPVAVAPAINDWFKTAPETMVAWQIAANPADANHVLIRPAGAGAVTRRIAVIYPRLSSAYDTAISTVLQTLHDAEITAGLDVYNYRQNEARAQTVLNRVLADKPDLILAMGSESVDMLVKLYRDGTIPVVTICAKDPVTLGYMRDYEKGSGTNFAFTSLNMPIEVQMAYLRELKPALRNISVLVDARNVSAIETQAKPISDAARNAGIRVVDGLVKDPAKARDELAQLIPAAVADMRHTDPDLKNSVFIITGSTAVFREIATINQHAGPVPVVSLVPEVVQAGHESAALSIGISFESNARLAAHYALDILANPNRAGQLKVGIVSPPDVAINFRRVRAIGMRVPFAFFETASFVYDYEGRPVRLRGQTVRRDEATPGG